MSSIISKFAKKKWRKKINNSSTNVHLWIMNECKIKAYVINHKVTILMFKHTTACHILFCGILVMMGVKVNKNNKGNKCFTRRSLNHIISDIWLWLLGSHRVLCFHMIIRKIKDIVLTSQRCFPIIFLTLLVQNPSFYWESQSFDWASLT